MRIFCLLIMTTMYLRQKLADNNNNIINLSTDLKIQSRGVVMGCQPQNNTIELPCTQPKGRQQSIRVGHER